MSKWQICRQTKRRPQIHLSIILMPQHFQHMMMIITLLIITHMGIIVRTNNGHVVSVIIIILPLLSETQRPLRAWMDEVQCRYVITISPLYCVSAWYLSVSRIGHVFSVQPILNIQSENHVEFSQLLFVLILGIRIHEEGEKDAVSVTRTIDGSRSIELSWAPQWGLHQLSV